MQVLLASAGLAAGLACLTDLWGLGVLESWFGRFFALAISIVLGGGLVMGSAWVFCDFVARRHEAARSGRLQRILSVVKLALIVLIPSVLSLMAFWDFYALQFVAAMVFWVYLIDVIGYGGAAIVGVMWLRRRRKDGLTLGARPPAVRSTRANLVQMTAAVVFGSLGLSLLPLLFSNLLMAFQDFNPEWTAGTILNWLVDDIFWAVRLALGGALLVGSAWMLSAALAGRRRAAGLGGAAP
jgi:hypothetical protein